jgi:long-subunit acyl-CoA synthetase (AMP-forming)
MMVIQGKVADNWETYTYQEYWANCMKFAKSMIALDVTLHSVVNILGFNSVSRYYIFLLYQ